MNWRIKCEKAIFDDRGKLGYWKTSIHRYDNFIKVIKMNLIAHKQRRLKFYNNILNARGSNSYKYLKSIQLGYNTTRSCAEYLGLSVITTRAYFKRLRMNKYLNVFKVRKFKQIVYALTNKGLNNLLFFDKIKQEINKLKNDTPANRGLSWTL